MYPEHNRSPRLATADRIRTIDFARSSICGTGSLSPRARRTLAVYIVLVKMGYVGLTAPMGAIADAVFRCSYGEAGSIRTLQRAHKELEQRDFIRSVNFRPGRYSKGTVIRFNLEAFAYWTRRQTENVSPFPQSCKTMCDSSSHATSCRTLDRTRDHSVLNSQVPYISVDTKPRAGARANKTTYRKDPVLFSLAMVLSKLQMSRADRRAVRTHAEIEIKSAGVGVELLNPTGIDWKYWQTRWDEFSIPVRETTVLREILPYFVRKPDAGGKLEDLEDLEVRDAGGKLEDLEDLEVRDAGGKLEDPEVRKPDAGGKLEDLEDLEVRDAGGKLEDLEDLEVRDAGGKLPEVRKPDAGGKLEDPEVRKPDAGGKLEDPEVRKPDAGGKLQVRKPDAGGCLSTLELQILQNARLKTIARS